MTLMEENRHIKNVAVIADPQQGNPYCFRVVVSTDLNPDTLDPAEREAVETLRATCGRHLRANGPIMTRMTLIVSEP